MCETKCIPLISFCKSCAVQHHHIHETAEIRIFSLRSPFLKPSTSNSDNGNLSPIDFSGWGLRSSHGGWIGITGILNYYVTMRTKDPFPAQCLLAFQEILWRWMSNFNFFLLCGWNLWTWGLRAFNTWPTEHTVPLDSIILHCAYHPAVTGLLTKCRFWLQTVRGVLVTTSIDGYTCLGLSNQNTFYRHLIQ